MNKTINIITLGCSKNIVDSENLLTQLKSNGYELITDGAISSSRNVIINTCGFIKDAKDESIETILQFAYAKRKQIIDNLYVMGCLSERYKNILKADIPEVDRYFGVDDLQKILKHLVSGYNSELINDRSILTPPHYAFLKISEGCNRKCAFCAIPMIRGEYRSVPIQSLQIQAENLINKGVKELILIAQDSSYYGYDIYGEYKLAELLKALSDINPDGWIRLHYLFPVNFPSDIIKVMKERQNICNYIDIPFQHISDNVLKNMRRGHYSKKVYELIDYFRTEIPDAAIRTTLIAGHPGETDKEFIELKRFVEKIKFDRLGVFAYSDEEGTYGSKTYKDDIAEEEKTRRVSEIMEIQQKISFELNHQKIGKEYKVIIDKMEGKYYIGRTQYDSPEVDNEVLIPNIIPLNIGDFYKVKITSANEFDLYGKVLD